MAESEWTRKLTRQQLAGIAADTKEHEQRNPGQRQQHAHKDIAQAYASRDHERSKLKQ